MSRSNSSQNNVTAITNTASNQISIHLGNYIISVAKNQIHEPERAQSPVKQVHRRNNSKQSQKAMTASGETGQIGRDRSRSPAITLPTTEMSGGSQSAIQFELNWIKFVKEAEDEYNRRMCRNEKPQPLSVFEVNVDVFELYLMKVSGRALQKVQGLNLDLKSSLCADMKLFDNQSGQLPPQHIIEEDQNAELEKRRQKRKLRRDRNRRQTAHFNTHVQEIEAALLEEGFIQGKEEGTEEQSLQQTHMFSMVDALPPQPVSIFQESPNQIVEPDVLIDEQQLPLIPEEQPASGELKIELKEVINNDTGTHHINNQQLESEIKEPSPQVNQMEEEIKQQHLIESPPPVPKKRKVMIDSLNDRSDDEDVSPRDGDRETSPIQETEEDEFDRDDMTITAANAQPVLQVFNSNGLTEPLDAQTISALQVITETPDVMSPELRTPDQNNTLNEEQYENNNLAMQDTAHNKLQISIDDQEEEKEQVQLPPIQSQEPSSLHEKIKIGDMTIEDPYMSINEQHEQNASKKSAIQDDEGISPDVGISGEHYTMQDVSDPMLNNSNPFREKSVISYINSPQKSIPKVSSEYNKSQEEVQIQHRQASEDFQQQITSNQQVQHQNEIREEDEQIPRSTTDPTQANIIEQKSNHSLFEHQQQSVNAMSANQTHRQENMIQMSSQQSLDPIDQTASQKELIHHIVHERNEDIIVNGNLADQNLSAITTGRHVPGNLSAMKTVRVPLEEEMIEPPEREVILRFEVAVGTTPLNMTFDEGSALYEHPHAKNDDNITPLDRTAEQIRDNLPELMMVDAATSQDKIAKNGKDVALSPHIVPSQNQRISKSQPHREPETSSPTRSLNASQEKQAKSLTPSRLEVTLTAEPDKPIMVEVRGGEKQFLISALTKHIYDILSQPNRLQIVQDENGNVQFADNSDPNIPGQHLEPVIDPTGNGAFKVGNQNINLRLKGFKKEDNLGLPVLQNLGGKNSQSNTSHSSKKNESLPELRASQQKANQSQQNIRQSLENIRQSNHIQSVHNRQEDNISIQGQTEVAANQSSCIKQNVNYSQKNISIAPSTQSLQEQQVREHSPQVQEVVLKKETELSPKRKRATVVASAEGKIQEEQIHSSFEGEIPLTVGSSQQPEQVQQVAKKPKFDQILQSKQVSNEGSFRKVRVEATSPQQRLMNAQDQLRSRPETANFNRAYAAAATEQIENPFINGQEDDYSSITQPRLETPRKADEQDISVADQTNSVLQKSHLETPGAEALEGIPYTQIQNSSSPAIFEDYVKSPLHPTIPEQHHNGYFSTESDYIMVMPGIDGNSLGNGGSSNSNDQYLTPKLAYFDQFNQAHQNQVNSIPTPQQIQQQLLRHQSINDFYSSQYGYSDADQNIEDFILAEGYPLLNFIQQDGNGRNSMTSLKTEIQSSQSKRHPEFPNQTQQLTRSKKAQQLYDFNETASYSHQNTLTHANLNTPPNAYRIRKVILPNYPNGMNASNQSDLEDSQKPSPLSTHHTNHNLKPLFNNMMHPNAPAAGALLRKQKTVQTSTKQLPMVKTRKRIFNNTVNSTIYSVNGGPAHRSIPLSQSLHARSLSPLRKKNHIFYTSNFIMSQKKALEQLQQLNAATQASTANNNGTLSNQTMGQLTVDDFAQFAYYSQSPQPRIKHSPYLSDDEYRILQNYYDIQCEPTGMHRGGVPLMKVKRVNKPKNRTFNIFNFPDDPTQNVTLPKALTSLQIFYPQFQPSQAEYMARTLASPSKWFDRFNQSTRNLNNTITNLHQQHSRKLRSYSISNLTSQNSAAVDSINDSRNMKARSGSQNSLFQKRNQIKERQAAMEQQRRMDNNSLSPPPETYLNNISHDFGKNNMRKNKKFMMKESGATNSSTFMPPLQKIYSASLSHHHHHENSHEKSRMSKKSTASSGAGMKNLPPRPNNKRGNGPKIGINVLGPHDHQHIPLKTATPTSDTEEKMPQKQKNLLMPTQSANIINTNHNQYVCFGVNIITKSDK